jgi:His-Xaa-Ser system radical SAM maturase HxsB
MASVTFAPASEFRPAIRDYNLLPFRFARIPGVANEVLITSETGEWAFIGEEELLQLVESTLPTDSDLFVSLSAKHFVTSGKVATATRLLAAQYRTRKSFLRGGPALHLFVVTLRCDHSCQYCQVSRRTADKIAFDMSDATAQNAIELMFASPAPGLTVEFQGGEPLLAFDRVRMVTERIVERNRLEGRKISFAIVSTLHHINDEILGYLRDYDFQVSTSIDGPAWLHDKNRPTQSHDAYERTVAGLDVTRRALGDDKVAALTTLTALSLKHPLEIIDEYVKLGFRSIFLRPLSPYGFAARANSRIGYSSAEFVAFYDIALRHILALNRGGIVIDEAYAALMLAHILTPFPTGYVDLRSPAGAGLGSLAYNYDGRVYASDEGRMLAEMDEEAFCLGRVETSYIDLMRSDAMQLLLATGVAESLPGCSDCAFLPYCGGDPVFHLATQGDPVGHRPTSDFCRKQTGIFDILFRHLAEAHPDTMRTFLAWVMRKAPSELGGA